MFMVCNSSLTSSLHVSILPHAPPLGSVVLCLALGNDSTIISEPFLLPYVILTPPESPAHCLTVGNVTFNVLISLAQNNLTSVLVL